MKQLGWIDGLLVVHRDATGLVLEVCSPDGLSAPFHSAQYVQIVEHPSNRRGWPSTLPPDFYRSRYPPSRGRHFYLVSARHLTPCSVGEALARA
jgi:hypothetical protein